MFSSKRLNIISVNKNFYTWLSVLFDFSASIPMDTNTPCMYQTLHLQNTVSLYEPNILKNTDSVLLHSQSIETEWLFLACSEKQKPPHKAQGYKWKTTMMK